MRNDKNRYSKSGYGERSRPEWVKEGGATGNEKRILTSKQAWSKMARNREGRAQPRSYSREDMKHD